MANDEWVTINKGGEETELTIRDLLKMLKKEFKKQGLMDRKIQKSRFDDTALIFIEDPTARYGYSSFEYGINEYGKVVVYRRH